MIIIVFSAVILIAPIAIGGRNALGNHPSVWGTPHALTAVRTGSISPLINPSSNPVPNKWEKQADEILEDAARIAYCQVAPKKLVEKDSSFELCIKC